MNDIWTLMKKYRFNIVNNTNKNILCTICNGLLINAHSSPCGCVYCFDCIRDYLDGMEKVCPGQSNECKKEMININKNVFPDNITNRNVLRTIVKCKERNCVFEDELKNIGDHIRICDYRLVECPFMNIGCKDLDIVNVDLKKHLVEEIVDHSKLMLDSMDNFRNEMELMKKNMTVLMMENKDLKKEIIDLKEENVLEESSSDEFTESIVEKWNEIDENLTRQIGGEFVWRIDKWKEKSESARSGINKVIYSDPFYSHRNGYKMCLSLWPNGSKGGEGTDLSVYFCLMRGEFDDILSWPFKHNILIELIDQRTKQVHTSKTSKYEDERDKNRPSYQKPTKEKNDGMGHPKFVSLSDLSNEKIGLCENNQLFIRCRVTII